VIFWHLRGTRYGIGVDPADGLLHVRNLPHDFYSLDRTTLTLTGRKQGNQFRLGSRLLCIIHRVDVTGRIPEPFIAQLQALGKATGHLP
jgi:exoribonuclease R